MGLAGYIDRDRTLNDTMSYDMFSSHGISYLRGEKLKEVTPFKETKKITAFYRNWGFPGGDIEIIRKHIYSLLDSFTKVIFVYPIGYDEEKIKYCKQCYGELLQCIEKENGIDEIIQLDRLDKSFFVSVYDSYVRNEISKKRACSFVEYYLSCRVRGMKLLEQKDKEIL